MAQYWKSARELWLKKRSEGLTNDQIVSDELNNIVLFDSGGNSNANTCAKIVSDWKNGKTDLTMLMITMWPASREISMVGLTTAIRSLKSVPSEEYFLTVLNEMKLCLDDEKKTVLDQFIQHTNHLIATLKKDFEFYDGAKEVLTNIIPTLLYRVDMNWSNYGAFYYSSNSNPILHGTTIKLLAEMLGFYKYKEELVEILLTNCTGPLSARMRYHFFRLLSDAMITRNDSNADSSIIRKFVEHAMLALESDLVLETEYEKKLLHLLDTGGYTDLIEKYKELVIKDSSLSVTNYLEIFGSLQNQKPATSPTAISSSSAAVAVAVPPPPTAHREVINKFLSQKVFQLITTDSPITTEFLAGLESKISTFTSFLNIIFLHSDTEDNSNDKVIQGVVTIIQGRQMTSLQIIIDHFSKDNLYLKIPKSARPCFNSVVHSYANMLSRETSLKDTLSNIFSNNWKILEILLRLCGFTIRTVYVNCLLESENRFALTEETMDYQEVFPIEGELMSDGTLTAVAVSKRLQIFGKIKGGLKEKSTVSLQNYYRIHEAKFNASGSKWVEDEYASVFLLILDAKHSKAAEKLKNTPPGAKASVNFGSHLPSNTSLSPGIVQFLRGNNVKEAFEFGCGVPAARTKVRELYMQLPQTLVPLVSISFYGTGRNTKITMEKKVPPQGHEIAKQTMADEQMLLTTVISCIKSKMMQCPDKAKIELHAYSTPSYLASKLTNIFNCSENKETITKLLRETTLEQRIQTHSVLPNDILDKSSCYQRILDICPVICLALTLSPTAATTLTSSSSSSGLQLTPGILPLSSVSSNPSSAAPNLNSFLQTSEDLNAKIQKIQENLNTLQATLAGKQALPVSNLGSTESLLPPNTSSTSNSIPLTGHAKKKYRDLLTELIIHSHKSLFVHPSVLPAEWTKLVSNPMDLSKVCDLFDGNKLATVDDFASHVRLVFNNAINYNIQRPDDVGMRIRSGFAKKALEYFDKRLIEVTASFSTKTETEQANVSSTTISYFKSSIDEQVTPSMPTLSTSTSHAMDADSFSIWTISRSK